MGGGGVGCDLVDASQSRVQATVVSVQVQHSSAWCVLERCGCLVEGRAADAGARAFLFMSVRCLSCALRSHSRAIA
eukprot:105381-Alexandrium_andersonii.AAC.1